MSFLISPIFDVGIRLTLNAAGNILYYTGSGLWWLGRRAIYGKQKSPEEEAHEERVRLIQQNEDLAEQVRLLREMVEEREKDVEAELKKILEPAEETIAEQCARMPHFCYLAAHDGV
jgi:hypothetical protein